MDVTYEALYTLYRECFPCYPLSREWFFFLLALEQGKVFTRWEGGALAGAAVLHGDSLPLLCVGKSFRSRGLGSQLLAQAEGARQKPGALPGGAGPGAPLPVPGGARRKIPARWSFSGSGATRRPGPA